MSLTQGDRLAHYEIIAAVGRGGMGEVFRAHDTRLDRDIALKVLPPELSEDEARLARFEHEARTLARLNHPNIVTVHSVEEVEGIRFLTMELIEGQTLAEMGPSGVDLGRFLDLMTPIARAVAAAHEGGLVHRDLKPGNVMVDGSGNVKVLDFGLAKSADSPAETDASAITQTIETPLTEAGQVLGTVAYMSPEQARGEEVDQRSDIFSLGVMMYELVTGRHPFKQKSTADTLSSILRDEPQPVTEDNPELPNHLGRIIRRCLEKEPSKRLQSALDLANELEGVRHDVTSGSVVSNGAPKRPSPAGVHRRWIPVAAVAAVAVLAILGFVLLRDIGSPEPTAPQPKTRAEKIMVVFPFENLGSAEDAYFAFGMADEISSRLARVKSLRLISRTSASQYDRTGKTMPQIASDLGVDYVLEGTVRWSGGGQGSRIRITPSLIDVSRDEQVWSDSYDEILEEVFTVQSRVAEQVIRELNLTLGETAQQALESRPTENLEAYRAYLRGVESTTHAYYSPEHRLTTIALFQEAVDLDPTFALAWAALSSEHSYFYHLKFDTTDARREAAREAVDQALKLDPDLPEAHRALGQFHYRCYRDYETAMHEFSIAKRSLPNDAELLSMIGAVQRRMGRFEESARTSERVVNLQPLDSTTRWDLGVTYAAMGDWESAFARLDESIAIAPSEAAPHCLKAVYTWISSGDLVTARRFVDTIPTAGGDLETWIKFNQFIFEHEYEAALRLMNEFPRPAIEHVTIHGPKAMLVGDIHQLIGNMDQARTSWEEALATVRESLETRSEDARIHAAHGQILARLGRVDEAIAAGRQAVELYPTSLDAFHGPYIELALVQIYGAVGELEMAFDGLEALLRGPNKAVISLPMLRLYPIFDTIRNHPRYLQLESEFGSESPSA